MSNPDQQVEAYYDRDAGNFDERYWNNHVLQRIRQDFREHVKRYPFRHMLEIGYGSGMDLVHFGSTHPDCHVTGIDISGAMHSLALQKIREQRLENVTAHKGRVQDLSGLFPGQSFDMVYVFFGALNTAGDLEEAARHIAARTRPGGMLVLSFVNRNYVAGMMLELCKLRFRAAFARWRKEWGGYSPSQHLPGRCYSPQQVRRAFKGFRLIERKGYSILHPAWYSQRINHLLRRASPWLWRADRLLNKTPLWSMGEYTLFVFQKPQNMGQ